MSRTPASPVHPQLLLETWDEARPSKRRAVEQPVAPLFAAAPSERYHVALPLLRDIRRQVHQGERFSLVLRSLPMGIAREYARWAIGRALLPLMNFDSLVRWGDKELWLWLVRRAVKAAETAATSEKPSRKPWRISRPAEVLELRRRYAAGESASVLAREFGRARLTIFRIVRGRVWANLPVEPRRVRQQPVKFSDAIVLEVRRRWNAGESIRSLASAFKMHRGTVSRLVHGRYRRLGGLFHTPIRPRKHAL